MSRDWHSRHNLLLSYGGLICFHYTMPRLPYSCAEQVHLLSDVYQRKVRYQLASEFHGIRIKRQISG